MFKIKVVSQGEVKRVQVVQNCENEGAFSVLQESCGQESESGQMSGTNQAVLVDMIADASSPLKFESDAQVNQDAGSDETEAGSEPQEESLADLKTDISPPTAIVLEEELDPHYVPTEAAIIEYATWLGMNLSTDQDLFWIAKEGLMAPLPCNWKPCRQSDSNDIYYFDFTSGESTWDHPCDGYYKMQFEKYKEKKLIELERKNRVP